MTPTELREALRSGDAVAKQAFEVLKTISSLLSNPETQALGQEMLLRALEHRTAFVETESLLGALVRSVGLFPYLSIESLSMKDAIAYEFHRPDNMGEDFVFHREQANVFRRLVAGDNVILSAPTSFGKSKIIDAMIATKTHENIVVVVPTLALIDETRRRLAKFSADYRIITHVSQHPSQKNIFVLTPERVVAYNQFPPVGFFVIDEFYKLHPAGEDTTRAVALNQAFYKLKKLGGQFYLLGPSVESIPDGLQEAFRCYFYPTRYRTVASDQIRVGGHGTDVERLVALCHELHEPTLIFCRSPARVNEVARALIRAQLNKPVADLSAAAKWVAQHYHPNWIYGEALLAGIGVHHGKLPRALAQYVVRTFNESRIRFLVCTSTLIEGVNTKAKNVVVFDNKIATNRIDFFTFNNIQGRSGRMFEHFVGNVYLFNDPPTEDLPFVDFPLFTQTETAPDNLLIQMDADDLMQASKHRVKSYSEQKMLPLEVLRLNASIDPDAQLRLASHILKSADDLWPSLAWNGMPTAFQLNAVCDLIWTYFVKGTRSKGGVFTARQLTFKVWQLLRTPDSAERVRQELRPGPYAAKNADEAVERVLEFERTWASFELPRFLMAISRVQEAVLGRLGLPRGDYSAFSTRVECFFQTPVVAALDEYGIPLQVAAKLKPHLASEGDLDSALFSLAKLDLRLVPLDEFEREIVEDSRASMA